MKKSLSILMAMLMLSVFLFGCGAVTTTTTGNDVMTAAVQQTGESPVTEASQADPNKPVKIGVSMGTTQNLFYSKMAQIIQDYGKEKGAEVIVSDENHDVSKQISTFENFISSGCTAIIAVAFNADGIEDVVKKAEAAGIFVMTYDGFVEGARGSLNLDNYVYGYQTGTMAADWINANPELKAQEVIEVGIFDYPDITLIIDRAKGIADALAEKAPNAKVVAQQKAGIGDEGNIQAENFLAAYPNMQVICGINDTGVLGAYEVFNTMNKTGDNIGLFGADGDPRALELISENTIYRGTVMSGAYDALPGAVDICIAASKGEEVDGHIIYDTVPVTIENVQEFLND